MLWIIIACLVITFVYWRIISRYNHWMKKGVPQTSYGFIWGDIWDLVFRKYNLGEMIQAIYHKYPKSRFVGIFFFLQPILVVKDPDLIKQISIKHFDHFINHQDIFPEHTFISENIFNQKDAIWREMRSTLSPFFTSSKMRYMFSLISKSGDQFVNHFLQKNEDLVVLDLKDAFTKIASDVIISITFGSECDSLKDPENEHYLMSKNIMEDGVLRSPRFFGYLVVPKLYNLLKISPFSLNAIEFFEDLVRSNVKLREKHNIVRPDMINILIQARKTGLKYEELRPDQDTGYATALESEMHKKKSHKADITDEEIASQGFGFFFAGYDTVSTSMTFMAYELAVNPDVQARLIEEVDNTKDSCDGKLTYEALNAMKYMDMVVSETLRKWPINVVTNRVCNKPFRVEPKYPHERPLLIEKGSLIWFPTFAIQRDPEFYPEPEKFDPERFNDENKRNIVPGTFVPFGIGPRNCLGSRLALLEAKAVFYHLLCHFEIVPVEKTKIPIEMRKGKIPVILEGGVWLGLKRRSEKIA